MRMVMLEFSGLVCVIALNDSMFISTSSGYNKNMWDSEELKTFTLRKSP